MLQRSLTRIPSRLTIGRPASPSSRPKSNKHTSISSSIANLVPEGMRSAPYLPRFLTPQSTQSVWVPPVEPKDQPMRKEAQRAFATFLRKGASRELNITDEMRRDCAVALRASSHPDVFVPVYQEIYGMLEQQSLPHFLSYAQTNINLPTQLFWYAVGIIDIGISVLILLLMVFLLPARPFAWRAVRLVSVIFASFGAMQTYSAWRGYCTQVAGRNALQVRPWELDDDREDGLDGTRSSEGDGERDLGKGVSRGSVWVNPWDALEGGYSVEASLDGHEHLVASPALVSAEDGRLGRSPTGATTKNARSTSDLTVGKSEPPPMADISPWLTMDKSMGPPRDSRIASSVASDKKSGGDDPHIISVGSPCSAQAETFMAYPNQSGRRPSGGSVQQQRFSCYAAQTRFLHRLLEPPKFTKAERQKQRAVIHRPPIFGPEKVVEDERVLRMHKRIIRDILVVGGVWGLVWVGVCLAIPSPR